jgi:hypothetical protein
MQGSDEFAFETRAACPACGSTSFETRFSCRFDEPPISRFLADYYGIDPAALPGCYRAEQCARCESYFQREVGNGALLGQLYSQWVFDVGDPMLDPAYNFDVLHPRLARDGHEIMAAAAALRSSLQELKTLDFGMGWASWARISQSLGCHSFGHDLSAARMDYAAQFGIAPHEAGNRYHLINAEQVFEHLVDPTGTIRMLAEALLPGGILKISLPSARGLKRLFSRLRCGTGTVSRDEIMALHPLEHVNCFSREGLRELARGPGLRVRRPFAEAFAYLGHRGTVDLHHLGNAAKELARPAYQLASRHNIYVWMQKPA